MNDISEEFEEDSIEQNQTHQFQFNEEYQNQTRMSNLDSQVSMYEDLPELKYQNKKQLIDNFRANVEQHQKQQTIVNKDGAAKDKLLSDLKNFTFSNNALHNRLSQHSNSYKERVPTVHSIMPSPDQQHTQVEVQDNDSDGNEQLIEKEMSQADSNTKTISIKALGKSILIAKQLKKQAQQLVQDKRRQEMIQYSPEQNSSSLNSSPVQSRLIDNNNSDKDKGSNHESQTISPEKHQFMNEQQLLNNPLGNLLEELRKRKQLETNSSQQNNDILSSKVQDGLLASANNARQGVIMQKKTISGTDNKGASIQNALVDFIELEIMQKEEEKKRQEQEEMLARLQNEQNNQNNDDNKSDESDIEMPDYQEDIDELIEQKNQEQSGTLISLFLLFIFIVHFIIEININSSTGVTSVLNKIVFEKYFNVTAKKTITDVETIEQMENGIEYLIGQLYTNNPYDIMSVEKVNSHEFEEISPFLNSTNSTSQQNTTSPKQEEDEEIYPLYAALVNKYNYFMGMRITTINANLKTNTNKNAIKVLPKTRDTIYYYINGDYSDTNRTLSPFTYSENGGYNGHGGFVQYFQGNMTYDDVNQKFIQMVNNNWFRNGMIETVLEAMFYNKNAKIGVIMEFKFFKSNTGQFIVQKKSLLYLPQNYSQYDAETVFKIILQIIFLIQFIFLLGRNSYKIYNIIKQCRAKQPVDIAWYFVVDLVVLGLGIASIVYWFKLFFYNRETFKLPLKDEDEFQRWCFFASDLRVYIRVSSFCIIFMFIRNLRVMTTQFPAFGVLFDTIKKAKTDLLYFFIFVIVLYTVAMVLLMATFGNDIKKFSEPAEAMMSIFQMMFGNLEYDEMENSNKTLAEMFFFVFVIIFYFIIMNFFCAIITRTYDNLRQRKQLVTEAMASILAKEAQKLKQQWINFLLCKVPKTRRRIDDDGDSFSDSDIEEDSPDPKKSSNIMQLPRQRNPSIRARAALNFNKLSIMMKSEKLKTREKFEKELYNAKVKILKKKKQEIKDRKQLFTNAHDVQSYVKLKEAILQLIYIIIFVSMILYQTKHETAQKANRPIKAFFSKYPNVSSEITFNEIEDPDDMMDFINQVVFPFIYDTNTLVQKANIAVGQYYMRFSLRFVNNTLNTDSATNKIFRGVHNVYSLGYSYTELDKQYSEIKSSITFNDTINYTISYTSPGDYETFDDLGGYVVHLPSNKTESNLLLNNILYNTDYMYYSLAMLTVDFVIFNPNLRYFVYAYITFDIDGSSFVDPSTGSAALYLDHFMLTKNGIAICLEIAYLSFSLFYFIKLILSLKSLWIQVTLEMKKRELPQNATCFMKFLHFIDVDYEKLMRSNIVRSLLCQWIQVILIGRLFFGILFYFFKFIYKILKVFWRKLTLNFFSFIDVFQAILTVYIIVLWGLIVSVDDFQLNSDGSLPDFIPTANKMSVLQNLYRAICFLNTFCTFLRILQFFSFSKRLSAFTEILSSAKYDILFFVIMFAFVILGYSIAAYAIYGGQLEAYSNLFYSAFALIRVLVSDFNYTEMFNIDPVVSGAFFVSYIVLFYIGLLNMFIAIIVAHYNQFRRECEHDEQSSSFFAVIGNILKYNLFKKRENKKFCLCFKCLDMEKIGRCFDKAQEKQQQKKEEEIINQQEEAQDIKDKFIKRVDLPVFSQYNVHQGLKSYFQGNSKQKINEFYIDHYWDKINDKNVRNNLYNNISIYKKAEEEGYNQFDYNNAKIWLFNLEEILLKHSNNRVSLYDFCSEDSIYSLSLDNLDPNQLNKLQESFLMIDKPDVSKRLRFFKEKTTSIYQKYDLWRAMDFERAVKIIAFSEDDSGIKLLQFINGIIDKNQLIQEGIKNVQFKMIARSKLFSQKCNKVTKMQHYLWTQVLTNDEKYLLWFEVFNTNDRVKLWNRLVFSENYFNYIAHTRRYQRADIKYIMKKLQLKIKQAMDKKAQEKEISYKSKNKESQEVVLTPAEIQVIRDKYYTSKVLIYVWNQLKKRRFEMPKKKKSHSNSKRKSITLSRREYYDMITSLFKLMISGLTGDRLRMIEKIREKGGANVKLKIYQKLVNDIFDENEYRLCLWLPLSQEEKLDMIMHERIEEEMELMLFMFDQEYDISKNIASSDKADILIERSLDQQIYQKYINQASYQAILKSEELCKERIRDQEQEDKQLMEYAGFLHEKFKQYDDLGIQLKNEIYRRRKNNEKLTEKMDKLRVEVEEKQRQAALEKKRQAQANKLKLFDSSNDDNDDLQSNRGPGSTKMASGTQRSIKKMFTRVLQLNKVNSIRRSGGGRRRTERTEESNQSQSKQSIREESDEELSVSQLSSLTEDDEGYEATDNQSIHKISPERRGLANVNIRISNLDRKEENKIQNQDDKQKRKSNKGFDYNQLAFDNLFLQMQNNNTGLSRRDKSIHQKNQQNQDNDSD